ncbi:hypothetical protein LEP1GSC077_0031 [Leptospira interrogans str. C10069]|uniref:Uncharacterized protein n=1 Tax=Leptospira interrogans str. UI 12621 TaxID=1049937 RepID=A0A0F6H3A1_LEPIR|nr:hypothetical protein LEP1GSC077_0031 [Leptospira interrogans str. C10069]EKO22662.1 hypothetical protein LEP1GSC104_0023 [Leptospira interrogans str. UI 12621]EMN64550.1 hypothetical protein LEP1GSC092_0087 [Leptospira interrogans serovar Pyrogenes str. R168]EMN79718.1 hypothetical protein LEP1GSC106_0547 [Leptospira interrogans serovar Grippotyphosa str. UI 12764]
MPVSIKIHNIKLNEVIYLKSDQTSKFWNQFGDVSCPKIDSKIVEDAVKDGIFQIKAKYFPKIRTIPFYYIVRKIQIQL